MDFGLLTMDCANPEVSQNSKQKSFRSLPFKQQRSATSPHDDEPWKPSKFFKLNDFDVSGKDPLPPEAAGSFLLGSGSVVSADDGQTMLCFSSSSTNSKPQEASFLSRDAASSRYHQFPFLQPQLQPPIYAKGSYGPLSRYRGPFTPSQWMELEHQALIYKHLVANVPVPSNLLIPIKKSLNPFALSSLSSGSYISNPLGWGSFHLGFSGNTDPEPGRCRRTDGKKWRCSRDAVPDQKYCERHINRGRHRSRKPVEGQTGHAVSGCTTSKVVPTVSSSVSLISSGGTSNSLGAMHHQLKRSLPTATNPSTDHLINRVQDSHGFSIISPTINLKSKDSALCIQKQQVTFEESTQPDFGLVSSYSLLNPSQKTSLFDSRNSDSLSSFDGQFVDNYPKGQSDRGSVAWPGELKSDWTQLSMSIPMNSLDFPSSSNSSQQKKLTLSPLRLSGEFDPIPMGLSVGNDSSEPIQKQTHWLPVSWGNSMDGGPLGEVLNSTSNTAGGSKNSSTLNLGTEKWDSSPHFGSSPTGVLQNSTFASLSSSSAGSSPRYENNKAAPEAASFRDDMLGSTIAMT